MTEDELKKHAGDSYEFGHTIIVVPLEYALDAIKSEREACAVAVEAERLECPTDSEGDQAYDTAIEHAANAVRMRSNVQIEGLAATKLGRSPGSSKTTGR